MSSQSATRSLAVEMRDQASDLRHRIGRYHDDGGVDSVYRHLASLLDEAAGEVMPAAALRRQIAQDLRAAAERDGDWYGGTTERAIHVVLGGPEAA